MKDCGIASVVWIDECILLFFAKPIRCRIPKSEKENWLSTFDEDKTSQNSRRSAITTYIPIFQICLSPTHLYPK